MMNPNNLLRSWKGLRTNHPVRLVRDVYHRMDGSPYGNIFYEPPGKIIAKSGMIGKFIAKSDKGILVYFDNGAGSVLGLVLDDYAVERYQP